MEKAFRFNGSAKYQPGPQKETAHDVGNLAEGRIQVQAGDPQASFEVTYPNIFERYRLPLTKSDQRVRAWNSHPLDWWQNQLNFAVWCATAGCGVSLDDHLNAGDPLLRSLYRFHVYYQVRRILVEVKAPLPQDQAWGLQKNPYDRRGYERICAEFGVPPHSDWRVKGPNRGLGRVYMYWTRNGYHPYRYHDGEYDPVKMSFTQRTQRARPGPFHIDYIRQDAPNADTAWETLIPEKGVGFTRPGVARLNDSIRTYVWAILGAQAQTRTGILGVGTAFDGQKQFLANVEDAIASPVDLPASIARYQDTLQYARSQVNYVFGVGLYMAPSDMLLHIGTITGYNNLIVVATDEQSLGLNQDLNRHEPHAVAPPDAPNDTGERGLVRPLPPKHPAPKHPAPTHPAPTHPTTTHPPHVNPARHHEDEKTATHPAATHPPPAPAPAPSKHASDHEEEKTALVVGGVSAGLLALWFLRR